jgi:hypothetical protein
LVAEYLSKLEDVLLLEEGNERRTRLNLELGAEDQKWLDGYSEVETAPVNLLKEGKDVAENFRRQCYALGLVDEQGEPIHFERQEAQAFVTNEVDAASEKSEYAKFPFLLPNPAATSNIRHNNQEDILEWQLSSDCLNDLRYDDDDPISLYSAFLTGTPPVRNKPEANAQIQSEAAP